MIALLSHQFIQYAFIAGTITAIVSSIMGYFVVLRAQAFAAESFTEIGFAGATGAVLIGQSSLTGTIIAAVIAALGIGALGKKIRGRDVEIGMLLSFALGLGVLFLKLYTTNATEAVGILFGSILSVTFSDLILSLVSGLLILIILSVIFRPLLFSSIDPDVAEARGVPVYMISIVFMILLAIAVSEAVLVVGVLLAFALILSPAATAGHYAKNASSAILLSVCLGLFYTWGGLFLALYFHGPVSFFIAGLASISYLVVIPVSHFLSPHFYKPEKHGDHEAN